MTYRQDWIRQIRARAAHYGIDPQAALAVASSEGLSGGVGDGGHAFGPFQLNDAGGVLTGRAGNHRGFAESPAGIDWALQQIAGVAKGLHGRAAVESIVRRFERPADPGSEITRALAAMSGFGGTPTPPSAPRTPSGPVVSPGTPVNGGLDPARLQLMAGLLMQRGGGLAKLGPEALTAALSSRYSPPVQQHPVTSRQDANEPQAGVAPDNQDRTQHVPGSLAEAFYDPLGSWDNGKFGGPIGHHSDHVHLSITNPQAMIEAIRYAQAHGLNVGENPYVGAVHPVHVKDSFHYRDFAGKYGGRQLGEAIDVSGAAPRMAAYYKWATANLR